MAIFEALAVIIGVPSLLILTVVSMSVKYGVIADSYQPRDRVNLPKGKLPMGPPLGGSRVNR
jgi:hypothetical protein